MSLRTCLFLIVVVVGATCQLGGATEALACPARDAAANASVPDHLAGLKATATTVDAGRGITIDFVAYPLPEYEGNPWSHWGEGHLAKNGLYYTAIGDHLGPDGNSYLYEYNPDTKTLRAVGDVLSAYGEHRRGDWGYGKVHGPIGEDACGRIYFSTYWGTRRGLTYGGNYTGDLLMRYDPNLGELVSLGVPVPEMGTPSTAMWQAGNLFYGEANHPSGKDVPWKEGKVFWVYDAAEDAMIYTSPDLIDQGSGRDIAIDLDGRAYFSGRNRELLRYDPEKNEVDLVAHWPEEGKLRASSEPAADGKIFMTTNAGDGYFAYLFDPADGSLESLAQLQGDTADLALSMSGEVAYFTPGAHGQARDVGFPLMEIDRAGVVRTITELGPPVDKAGGPYPAGTYSYDAHPEQPGVILILTNAGPRGSEEAFGQPLLMVVHLPGSEQR